MMLPDLAAAHYQTPPSDELIKPSDPRVPICKSEELLQGDKLYIQHGERVYCLRLTKAGRLLLTK